ncbi:hypothetical protein P618_200721 [Holospora obtusa F1]|uniref:Uncharacterized protein n=1 Tax=Holospora obtusa F1 TaxID=1399147 RepID=W6TDH3_HOLOB|nr:hypothetical protein [Holospora obtusa]ETZ07093.1 hypothetical protein P618_200721 [Holospora obtusa F1]
MIFLFRFCLSVFAIFSFDAQCMKPFSNPIIAYREVKATKTLVDTHGAGCFSVVSQEFGKHKSAIMEFAFGASVLASRCPSAATMFLPIRKTDPVNVRIVNDVLLTKPI